MNKIVISVVIPVYNETESLKLFVPKLKSVMDKLSKSYECLFIDDGSTDSSLSYLKASRENFPKMRIISFKKNFGQTAAMKAGFDYAKGDIIVTIDSDMQNDIEDIPVLIKKLYEGYDVVSGWRKDRKDALLSRIIPSKIANCLISKISGVHLHDYGCSLKAYKKEVIKPVSLYGQMHRFIPVYTAWQGANITEIPTRHHPRNLGKSKYGLSRTFKVILDLIVIKFLENYLINPIYLFGGAGLVSFLLSSVSFFLMLYFKFFGGKSFIETPLPLLTIFFIMSGIIFIMFGLVAELLTRTYYESQQKPIYYIKETTP